MKSKKTTKKTAKKTTAQSVARAVTKKFVAGHNRTQVNKVGRKSIFTAAQKKKAVARLNKGEHREAIAKDLGCSSNSLYAWRHIQNIQEAMSK